MIGVLRILLDSHSTPDNTAAKSCGRIVGRRYTPLRIALAFRIAWKYIGKKKVAP